MPQALVEDLTVPDLDAIKEHASGFQVTPSALTMRARRLGVVTREAAETYLIQLAEEFAQRPKTRGGRSTPVNGVRRYSGAELSRRMFTHSTLVESVLATFVGSCVLDEAQAEST